MAKHHTNFLVPTSVCLCLLIFAAHVVAYGPRVTTSRDPPEEIGGVIQMRPRDFRRRGYIAGASPLKPHTIQKRASYFVAVAGDQTCTGTVCGCTCTSIGNEQCYSQAELDQAVANVGGCDVVMKAIGGDCSAAPAHAPAGYNLGTCKKAGTMALIQAQIRSKAMRKLKAWGSWGSWESDPPPVRTVRVRSLSAPSEEALISPLHDSQPHLPGASCTEGQSTGCTPDCAAMGGVCKVVNGQCSCNIGASAQRVVESSAGATCPGGIIGLPYSQPCPAHFEDNGSRPRVCCPRPRPVLHLVETSAVGGSIPVENYNWMKQCWYAPTSNSYCGTRQYMLVPVGSDWVRGSWASCMNNHAGECQKTTNQLTNGKCWSNGGAGICYTVDSCDAPVGSWSEASKTECYNKFAQECQAVHDVCSHGFPN